MKDWNETCRIARDIHVAALEAQKEKARSPDYGEKGWVADRIPEARQQDGNKSKVYFLRESGMGAIKIGTSVNVAKRICSLNRGTPHNLVVAGFENLQTFPRLSSQPPPHGNDPARAEGLEADQAATCDGPTGPPVSGRGGQRTGSCAGFEEPPRRMVEPGEGHEDAAQEPGAHRQRSGPDRSGGACASGVQDSRGVG
jgi:hypothetical protein